MFLRKIKELIELINFQVNLCRIFVQLHFCRYFHTNFFFFSDYKSYMTVVTFKNILESLCCLDNLLFGVHAVWQTGSELAREPLLLL